VKTYERLTPLVPQHASLGDSLMHIRDGDCVIAFGRRRIYALKRLIETMTRHKCCVVYGRLPPEARAKQVRACVRACVRVCGALTARTGGAVQRRTDGLRRAGGVGRRWYGSQPQHPPRRVRDARKV
jgi:hypothetical protein